MAASMTSCERMLCIIRLGLPAAACAIGSFSTYPETTSTIGRSRSADSLRRAASGVTDAGSAAIPSFCPRSSIACWISSSETAVT